MKLIAVLVLCAATALATPSPKSPIAYSADVVVVSKGTTSRIHVVSDGIRTATRSADGKSGSLPTSRSAGTFATISRWRRRSRRFTGTGSTSANAASASASF